MIPCLRDRSQAGVRQGGVTAALQAKDNNGKCKYIFNRRERGERKEIILWYYSASLLMLSL